MTPSLTAANSTIRHNDTRSTPRYLRGVLVNYTNTVTSASLGTQSERFEVVTASRACGKFSAFSCFSIVIDLS